MENSAIFPVTRKVTININTAGISFVFRHARAVIIGLLTWSVGRSLNVPGGLVIT